MQRDFNVADADSGWKLLSMSLLSRSSNIQEIARCAVGECADGAVGWADEGVYDRGETGKLSRLLCGSFVKERTN